MRDDGRTQYYGRGPEAVEERVERHPKKTGIFGGNRSLTIIFIDVMIVLVIYAIYVFFLSGPTTTETIGGYEFSISATKIGTEALVTLDVRPPENGSDEAGVGEDGTIEDPIVVVRFLDADGAVAAEVKDVLPQSGGSDRVFQHQVEVGPETGLLSAEIEALSESVTVQSAIQSAED
ncbi:MAG: hypothetical protein ACQETQ_06060 [Spirochaetota bacterium]